MLSCKAAAVSTLKRADSATWFSRLHGAMTSRALLFSYISISQYMNSAIFLTKA